MYILFLLSLVGFIVIILPYFLSLEHLKLEEKYGEKKGKKIGEASGVVSGWGFFLFWFGIWFSPQARFYVPVFNVHFVSIPILNVSASILHVVIFIPCFVVGAWFGIKGVIQTTLKVAETHRPTKLVTTGVYSVVRHPQYFGGLLAHVGFSFLLSALYSLLSTPLIIVIVYFISRKEEYELKNEFGRQYIDYAQRVPMLLPNVRRMFKK